MGYLISKWLLPVVLINLAEGRSVRFLDILGPLTVPGAYSASISLEKGVKALPIFGFSILLQLPSKDLIVLLLFVLQSGIFLFQSHIFAISLDVSTLKYLPSKCSGSSDPS